MIAEIFDFNDGWLYVALWFVLLALCTIFVLIIRAEGRRRNKGASGLIETIEAYDDDVTFWFDHSDAPWSTREFVEGSEKRLLLEEVELAVLTYNEWARRMASKKE